MKKAGVVLVILILVSIEVIAQQSHPASQIEPGSFASGNFNFNGSVGIGVTNPTKKLHVESDSGVAIYGKTTASWVQGAVSGETNNSNSWAVLGRNSATTGIGIGVYGAAHSNDGFSAYFWGGSVRFPSHSSNPTPCDDLQEGSIYFNNGDSSNRFFCGCVKISDTYKWTRLYDWTIDC
ncbi:hypothetical protein ACFLZB_02115 [Nanoarchaeota archaeon]